MRIIRGFWKYVFYGNLEQISKQNFQETSCKFRGNFKEFKKIRWRSFRKIIFNKERMEPTADHLRVP